MKTLISLALAGSLAAGLAGEPIIADPSWLTANSTDDGDQDGPAIAANRSGHTAVVWEDITDSGVNTIKAAGFSAPSTRAYTADVTVSQTTGQHHDPDVAVSAAGDAWIVWADDSDIALAHVSRTGALLATIGPANSISQGRQTHPAIAATHAGDLAITWVSDHSGVPGVWARSFRAALPVHAEVPAAGGGLAPRIGVDEQGGVVLAWTVRATDLDVWVRGLNPDGTGTGRLAAQRLGRATVGKQEQMVVAVSPYGEVSVAYTDDMDGNTSDQIVLGVGILNTGW